MVLVSSWSVTYRFISSMVIGGIFISVNALPYPNSKATAPPSFKNAGSNTCSK